MYTHVIRSKLGRVWVLGFAQQEGKRRDWHTWWCSLQDGRGWKCGRSGGFDSTTGPMKTRALLPRVFVADKGPDEDLVT